jgi:hypothetical protein
MSIQEDAVDRGRCRFGFSWRAGGWLRRLGKAKWTRRAMSSAARAP